MAADPFASNEVALCGFLHFCGSPLWCNHVQTCQRRGDAIAFVDRFNDAFGYPRVREVWATNQQPNCSAQEKADG